MNELVLVSIVDGQAVTTSLAIAEGTDVEHKSVIQLVRNYLSDLEEFGRVTFEMRPFETAGGTQQREIAILNEQQSTLVLTYMRNSEIVRGFKKRLVKAFWELAKAAPMSLSEIVLMQAQIAVNLEREQKAQSARIATVEDKLTAIEDKVRQFDGDTGYMTVLAFARKNGIRLPLSQMQVYGKRCTLLAKQSGIQIGRVPDERFGSVNSYPVELLDEVFGEEYAQ